MIDSDLIKHLDDSQKQRLQTLERFFAHDGWKLLVGYLEQQFNLSQELVNNAQDWDKYVQARTRMQVMYELSRLPAATQQEFEQMALENQAQAEEVFDEEELNYE